MASEAGENNGKRRVRITWDYEKDTRFLKAMQSAGGLDASPREIWEAMEGDMEGITIKKVAGHLQHIKMCEKKAAAEKRIEEKWAAKIAKRKKLRISEAGASESPLGMSPTSDMHGKGKSPAWFPSNAMESWLPSIPKQDAQPNLGNRPVEMRSKSKKKKSTRDANREAMLIGPSIPVIDLTRDRDCEQVDHAIAEGRNACMNSNSAGYPRQGVIGFDNGLVVAPYLDFGVTSQELDEFLNSDISSFF